MFISMSSRIFPKNETFELFRKILENSREINSEFFNCHKETKFLFNLKSLETVLSL